jgi:hypothetical protein
MRRVADPEIPADLRLAFRQAVNMTPAEIESWLARPESLSVGTIRPGENESVGRQYGRRIIALHGVRKLTPEHAATMRKVVGYVRRHTAQRPRGDITRTRWRFALMNWAMTR